ncbi:MAG TPA: glycosyltransferase [Cyclobacteriaceae bacterium]|nr:glycosyltransferase [Cyclobacteriaceae bacterium]
MPRVLVVIVLYFPEKEPERFQDDTLIIDNTHNNIGIAAALNIGLKKAIDENYDWLLTMDQDSVFEPGALENLKQAAFSCDEKTAWVSPTHITQKGKSAHRLVAMTSGSMLRVSACKQIGLFEEKLFIDSVDNEYCLRLRKSGFKIHRVDNSVLTHSLGPHNAARRYYITRNMLYVMFKYPIFFPFGSKELIKSFLLILFVEDDKHRKIRSFFIGVIDFLRGRYGPR